MTSTQSTDTSISYLFCTRMGIFPQSLDRKHNIWYYIIIAYITKVALEKLVCQEVAYKSKHLQFTI